MTGLQDPGRPGQRWRRTMAAQVVVHDLAVLRDKALDDFDSGTFIEIGDIDDDDDLPDTREVIASTAEGALNWLIDPTAGLWPLMESGAVLLEAAEHTVGQVADRQFQVSWSVQVKLGDLAALRTFAVQNAPDAAGDVSESLASAWIHAAEPAAPLIGIPAITWIIANLTVERVKRR
ncbi:hypothetical protein ITP53_43745 [Nonomuraea sp. K274]|uniref:Uncharacterized protein n=1 Tax=Nonomuraea cypriaca TaxID=1187855 RepID=A0A931AGM2_9ACTN|nr:hypothetical protein [Nonomuraea cypriaca]MBF8192481.1 hypothetical protein [Nonomuraea cypriaca]